MNNDLVSVVLPAYNAEKTISSVLSNVAEQTYRPLEIILVDDGSTDGTAKVIQNFIYLKNNSHDFVVKYIHQNNGGPSKARNKGIIGAKGKYIAFLDSDDYWESEKLTKQIELFTKYPFLDVVFTDSKILRRKNGKVREFSLLAEKNKEITLNHPYMLNNPTEKLLVGNFITTPSLVAKRCCFKNNCFFNENRRHMEDWELWLNMSLSYNFGYIHESCVNVIDEGDGLHSDYFNMTMSQINVVQEFVSKNRSQLSLVVNKKRLSDIIKEHFKWGGLFLMQHGLYERARVLYKQALKEKMDPIIPVYILESYLRQYIKSITATPLTGIK